MIKIEQITKPGMLNKGDLILVEKKNGVVFPATVKTILHQGSEDEEIIYSKRMNYYIIMEMVFDGSSRYVQSVAKVIDGEATCVINNMKSHI